METGTVLRSFAIGATCGLRSMTGPAVVRWRARDPARLAWAALALGELVADKLPSTPARTIPPALAFRALSGGFAGRSLAGSLDGERPAGTLAGAAGSVLAAYGGMALRAAVVRSTGLPDLLVALVEDVVAVGGAIAISRPRKPDAPPN
jgi:uncharacterized membrane protein